MQKPCKTCVYSDAGGKEQFGCALFCMNYDGFKRDLNKFKGGRNG